MTFRFAIFATIFTMVIFFLLHQSMFFSKRTIELATNIDVPILNAQEIELNHLACIMDGNRRWAKKQGLIPWYGHKEGIEAVKKVIEFCIEKKIRYLTLYTFSLENFNRSKQENDYLFNLMVEQAKKGVDEFIQHGIRLRFIGDPTLFPEQIKPLLQKVEHETAQGTTLDVVFLFCYGGRQELAHALRLIANDIKNKKISPDQITCELINDYLWTSGIPDPDLIIRTGGFSRLSNFLLFQSAYAEIQILDCLWPEITKDHLQQAYMRFAVTKRNFGK